MKKIEVGMLVRIVDGPGFDNLRARKFIGHVGRVLRECHVHPGNWDIEGAERNELKLQSFPSKHLQPIDDKPETVDFHEMMDNLKYGKIPEFE